MTILEAAKKGAEWMRWWVANSECDCETGHSCGLTERKQELEEIERTIKAEEEGVIVASVPHVCSICGGGYGVMKPVYRTSHEGPLCHKCDRE